MGEVVDAGSRVSPEDRLRLHAATVEANKFFHRELSRTKAGWPVNLLREGGFGNALSPAATWRLAYAPDSRSRLTDYLRELGFDRRTLLQAGHSKRTSSGALVDRYRGSLMFVCRNSHMASTGFVAVGNSGELHQATPATPIHRPADVLVGILEQIDLLRQGATPVIVDHPIDAMAIGQLSSSTTRRYVGVPTAGSPLSIVQAQTLARYARCDRVIVMAQTETEGPGPGRGLQTSLSRFFGHVLTDQRPPGNVMSGLARTAADREDLLRILSVATPLRSRRNIVNDEGIHCISPSAVVPGLSL